jgi:hypothetical protein
MSAAMISAGMAVMIYRHGGKSKAVVGLWVCREQHDKFKQYQ